MCGLIGQSERERESNTIRYNLLQFDTIRHTHTLTGAKQCFGSKKGEKRDKISVVCLSLTSFDFRADFRADFQADFQADFHTKPLLTQLTYKSSLNFNQLICIFERLIRVVVQVAREC